MLLGACAHFCVGASFGVWAFALGWLFLIPRSLGGFALILALILDLESKGRAFEHHALQIFSGNEMRFK